MRNDDNNDNYSYVDNVIINRKKQNWWNKIIYIGIGLAVIILIILVVVASKYSSDIKFSNANEYLDIKTYDGSNQPLHPKVLYFEEGWNGYKFWMTYSPLPNESEIFEDPCIAVSNDGVNWDVPTGGTNPLASLTKEQREANQFYNDPHLVMNNGIMECWFGWYANGEDVKKSGKYRMTSTDGVNWTSKEYMFNEMEYASEGNSSILSQSLIFEDNMYKMWSINLLTKKVIYGESIDGRTWVNKRNIDIGYTDPNKQWHLDVMKSDDTYYMVVYCHDENIIMSTSKDNITWTKAKVILSSNTTAGTWDSTGLYRSSIVKVEDEFYLYYTGKNNGVCRIGLAKSIK